MMIASIWLQQGHHLSPLQTGMMTLGYLVTVLAMIRVGENCFSAMAPLPMMTGPLLTATGITLISCTFLSKEVYIVTVFLSNILFGLGLGCYATPSTDTAVMNAPENKVGVASGIYKMGSSPAAQWGSRSPHRCTRYGCRWERPVPRSMPCFSTVRFALGRQS